nr:augmin subunit 5 [Quercus suber]
MGNEEGTSNGGGIEGTEGFHYLKSEAMNSSRPPSSATTAPKGLGMQLDKSHRTNQFLESLYWDTRQLNPMHTQQLPDRCCSITVRHPLMVVGTAYHNLIVFNLQNPQQPLAAREYASSTIIRTCLAVVDISNGAKDLIDKEVLLSIKVLIIASTCFHQPHRHSFGSMGANGSTGPEAVAAVEKNAALLTVRAGSRDLSAIPSICNVSAALQYVAPGSDVCGRFEFRIEVNLNAMTHLRIWKPILKNASTLAEKFSMEVTQDLCLSVLPQIAA